MYVLTEATLLINNEEIADRDQRVILNEMRRFLNHPSAGVKSFDQMPASWTSLVSGVLAGGAIAANAPEAREVVGAWHQEVRDLSLVLSRQLATDVAVRIPRKLAADPLARQKADLDLLAKSLSLQTTLVVPDAAAPIDVYADLQKRSVIVSMKLRAPTERKSTKARVTWLLRQLASSQPEGIHVRLLWLGRAAATQHPLSELRENPEIASVGRETQAASSFEILLVRDLGGRFGQRKNFITELETVVPEFYEQVGQHLRAWQPPAPKIREEAEPAADEPRASPAEAASRAADMHDDDNKLVEPAAGEPAPPSGTQ